MRPSFAFEMYNNSITKRANRAEKFLLFFLFFWQFSFLEHFSFLFVSSSDHIQGNRVGGNLSPLSHHRTCRSAYGGST
jgi:hypothetical protein